MTAKQIRRSARPDSSLGRIERTAATRLLGLVRQEGDEAAGAEQHALYPQQR